MEREEIIKRFQAKGLNEETINLILGAIEDFEATKLDKYVPTEEVVDRICKNLSKNVKYVEFETEGTCGRFLDEEGQILLAEGIKDDSEKIKSVFFHELVHCITTFKELDMVGFHTTIKDIDGEDERFVGYGLNEGVTSYIERKRNEQRNYKGINSYPILNSLVENLIMVVGEEKILNSYFNEPDELENVLMSRGISNEISVISGFDEIRHCERKVLEIKRINKNQTARFFLGIFGEENHEEKDIYAEMGSSVDLINDELFGAIECAQNIEDFEELTKFIARLDGQKFGIDKNKIFGRLLKERQGLIGRGVPEEELEKVIDDCGVRRQVEMQKDFEGIFGKDKDEFLIKLNDAFYREGEHEYEAVYDILNEPSYNHSIMKKLFNRDGSPVKARDILPIGEILKENPEMFLDDISISIYGDGFSKMYLVTDSQGNKFFYSSAADVSKISEDNIGKGHNKWEDEDFEIKVNEDSSSLTVTEDGEEMEYSLREKMQSNFEIELFHLNKVLKGAEERLAKLVEFGAPERIMAMTEEFIESKRKEIDEIKKDFFERKKKRKIDSKEVGEAFEGELEDVEKADKKKEVMQATIKLLKDQKENGQNIDDDK